MIEGETGFFFDHQTADGVIDGIEQFERAVIRPEHIRALSRRFDVPRFIQQIRDFVCTS